jgi:CBS domain containing-hemolysin-like protein
VYTELILAVSFAIIVSACCSVTEAVLYSLPSSQIELLADRYPGAAALLKKMKSNINRPITAILTLNTLANTLGAAVAGAAAASVFGEPNLIWFSLVFTLSILLFSEILPKTVGVVYSQALAPHISYPLHWMTIILRPIITLCQMITLLVPDRTGVDQVSAEELRAAAMLSRKAGAIAKDQERVIANILELGNKTVRQVMTPRTVTFMLEKSMSISEAVLLKDKMRMHSRIPVYQGDMDEVVGIALNKDIYMAAAENRESQQLGRIMRQVDFVPETAPLDRVFLDFFERHQHLFVVVDEYGSVTGVISMEDIIEEIVGREIVDESDRTKDMRELARVRKRAGIQEQ